MPEDRLVIHAGPEGWLVRHEGAYAEQIRDLFGTDTLPSPFTLAMPGAEVQARIQALNPGREVVLGTPPMDDCARAAERYEAEPCLHCGAAGGHEEGCAIDPGVYINVRPGDLTEEEEETLAGIITTPGPLEGRHVSTLAPEPDCPPHPYVAYCTHCAEHIEDPSQVCDGEHLDEAECDVVGTCPRCETAPLDRLDVLVARLASWCSAQGLPHESADELRLRPGLTAEQKAWLDSFIFEWDGGVA